MWNNDDLTLLLLHDNNAPEAWVDAWTRGYPLVQTVGVSATQSANERLTAVQAAFAAIASQNVVTVAHGMGANALLSWHYAESWTMHKRLRAAILLAPQKAACTSNELRVRFQCPTAVCAGCLDDGDWLSQQAPLWQARFFALSDAVNQQRQRDWQWGMQLMQEMVLR